MKGNNDLNFAKLIFSRLQLWLRLLLPRRDLSISDKMAGINLRADDLVEQHGCHKCVKEL